VRRRIIGRDRSFELLIGLFEKRDRTRPMAAVIALIAVERGDDALEATFDVRDILSALALAAYVRRHGSVLRGGLRRKGSAGSETEQRKGECCDSTTEKHMRYS